MACGVKYDVRLTEDTLYVTGFQSALKQGWLWLTTETTTGLLLPGLVGISFFCFLSGRYISHIKSLMLRGLQ